MSESEVKALKKMLTRSLRDHDKIASALRTGSNSPALGTAIDDMKKLKVEAAEIGCYSSAPHYLTREKRSERRS